MSSLLDVVKANAEEMNLINLSTALHRIAKIALGYSVQGRDNVAKHEVIQELRRLVVKHVCENVRVLGKHIRRMEQQSEMRCLSIICWSCATLRIKEEALLEHTAVVSSERLSELKPFELSNLLWAFAKLSFGQASVFERFSQHVQRRAEGEFSPQCLSTIVWAFGTVKVHQASMFTSVARELADNAMDMAPQGIANTAWAFARVRRQEGVLFRMLAEATIQESVVWSFKPQELSNIVWAFATVGLTHPPLFEKIVHVAVAHRLELPPQNVANMLWAYAKLGVPARVHLFPPLLEVTVDRLAMYKPQEVSAILWALSREATFSPDCREFFLTVPEYFAWRLHQFTSQALACMVEAYTLAEIDDSSFFDDIMRESVGRLSSFQPPSLCTLFRGVALKVRRSPTSCGEFLLAISEHIASRLSEMQQHNIMHLIQTMELLPQASLSTSTRRLSNSSAILALKGEELVGSRLKDAASLLAIEKSALMDPGSLLCVDNSHDQMCAGFAGPEGVRASKVGCSTGKPQPQPSHHREAPRPHGDLRRRLPPFALEGEEEQVSPCVLGAEWLNGSSCGILGGDNSSTFVELPKGSRLATWATSRPGYPIRQPQPEGTPMLTQEVQMQVMHF